METEEALYTDKERAIFGPYNDGNGLRFGDPLRIERRLAGALDGAPGKYLHLARHGEPMEKAQAQERLTDAARHAFELPPFDVTSGEGILDEDASAILDKFLAFLRVKKKSTLDWRGGSEPTEQVSSGGRPPTPSTSDSPSTKNGSGCSACGSK